MSAIFWQSVETIKSLNSFFSLSFNAISIVYAINGLPHKSIMFFKGIDFELRLAGIIHKYLKVYLFIPHIKNALPNPSLQSHGFLPVLALIFFNIFSKYFTKNFSLSSGINEKGNSIECDIMGNG